MAFEPLKTDEKIEGPIQKQPDMDSAMLFGCTGFVFTSIAGYLLSVWPFLVLPDTEKISKLAIAVGVGLIPAAVLGVFATRKFALAGACGFVGGSLSTGIFLYLRLEQVFISATARQAPAPDYPQVMMYVVPLGWILASAILALIALPRDYQDK